MANCHYHPAVRASSNCGECKQHICDRCRLNGNGGRCEACSRTAAKGGAAGRPQRLMCTNHKDVPVDTRCKRCRKPHCPACLNGATHCFRCALEPDEPRNGRGTGKLPRQGTGKLGPMTTVLPGLTGGQLPQGARAALAGIGVGVVLAVGAWGWGHYRALTAPPPPPPAYMGATGVSFLQPRARSVVSGPLWVKLAVTAPTHIDQVVLTIDGKYWARFTKAPFVTEWPSGIVRNGPHTLEAKVVYRGKKRQARSRIVVVSRNRFAPP